MWAKQTVKSGFTIVELLIVIVVIGILAAITIVAYNGVQERASQSKTVSALSRYAKALAAYAVDNDGYPNAVSGCLGGKSNTSGRCLNVSGVNGSACFGLGGASNTVAFDGAMKPYLTDNAPTVGSGLYSCGGTQYGGGYYYGPNATSGYLYVFFAASLTNCPAVGGLTVSSLTRQDDAVRCQYRLPTLP